jgi:uncharacterized SAM-binding protein YcdF (DUF218 family)
MAGIFLLLFCTNDFIADEFMRAWEVPVVPIAAMKKQYSWGIILSGVVRSEMELKDRVYFQRGADRVIHALQLYKAGILKKILVSGGATSVLGRTEPEADEIASVLIMMGVKREDIVTENRSKNTHDSAVEVKLLLTGIAKPSECLLITSAFHMRRSSACFEKVGWGMDKFSTDFLSHKRKFALDLLLIPQLDALSKWHVLTKEWVGYIVYAMVGYI